MILGIDPGKEGAVVLLSGDGKEIIPFTMPVIGKELDRQTLLKNLISIGQTYNPYVYVENVHAIHGCSAASTFSFGYVCGALHTAIEAARLSYTLVSPKTWQKEMFQGIPVLRKPAPKGKKRGPVDTKKMALIAAQRLFPTIDLRASIRCKNPHEGIVDALLIAEYGRRQLVKGCF
jgi:hypothetical protein